MISFYENYCALQVHTFKPSCKNRLNQLDFVIRLNSLCQNSVAPTNYSNFESELNDQHNLRTMAMVTYVSK